MRYLVSAVADDLPPEDMLAQIRAVAAPEAVTSALAALAGDPDALEDASMAVLANAWDDPAMRATVDGALDAASAKLPVVEVGMICVVAIYGLWLAATRGRKSERRTVRRNPDGSWSEETVTAWYGPSEAVGAIVEILAGIGPPDDAIELDPTEDSDGAQNTPTT